MSEIARNVIAAFEAGQGNRERRRQRNALDEAGRLYGAGQYDQAENALMAAGMPDVAGNYSALAQARLHRQNRTRIAGAMTALDPNATPDARLQAGAGAALEAGDVDQWAVLQQAASQMSAQQRQVAGERAQWIGSAAASLLGVPMEQRADQARQLLAASPYAGDEALAAMIDDAPELSDEALNAAAQTSMSAAEILGMRTQADQFNRSLAVQRMNAGQRYTLTPAQVRQFGNDYEGGLDRINQALGPQIMSAMPWASRVAADGQVPEDVNQDAALINDQGMLRAVARLQTGVGVLTEGEVRGTLGDNLANRLAEGGATFMLNERLRPEVRQALAQLVQSGVNRASTQAWNYRDNSILEYQSQTGGQEPVGWALPSIPHAEDFGALNAAERIAGSNGAPPLRPNDVRIAPSGREYTYMGPGNWLPRAVGQQERYQAGRDARVAAGGTPTVSAQPRAQRSATADQQRELYQHRNDPRALESYNRVFGDGAAERVIDEMNREQQPGGYRGR